MLGMSVAIRMLE